MLTTPQILFSLTWPKRSGEHDRLASSVFTVLPQVPAGVAHNGCRGAAGQLELHSQFLLRSFLPGPPQQPHPPHTDMLIMAGPCQLGKNGLLPGSKRRCAMAQGLPSDSISSRSALNPHVKQLPHCFSAERSFGALASV